MITVNKVLHCAWVLSDVIIMSPNKMIAVFIWISVGIYRYIRDLHCVRVLSDVMVIKDIEKKTLMPVAS